MFQYGGSAAERDICRAGGLSSAYHKSLGLRQPHDLSAKERTLCRAENATLDAAEAHP